MTLRERIVGAARELLDQAADCATGQTATYCAPVTGTVRSGTALSAKGSAHGRSWAYLRDSMRGGGDRIAL
jgi:hypothetical protein